MDLDAYDNPDAERLLSARQERLARRLQNRRELIANCIAAGGFLVAATLLAVLAPWHSSLSVVNLALVLVVWVAVERVKFPVASYGHTRPCSRSYRRCSCSRRRSCR